MVSTKAVDGVQVISIEGSIDSNTAPAVQEQVLAAMEGKGKVVLDMSKVNYLSSAGLRMLLLMYRQMKSTNGRLVLVGVAEEIVDVMRSTGFADFFIMADNLDSGIKALK
jgi:anti-sigma B factor antagonist